MRISIAYVTLKLYSKKIVCRAVFFNLSSSLPPKKKPNQLHVSQKFTSQLQPPEPNFTTH